MLLWQGCTSTKFASQQQLVRDIEAQYYWGRGTFLTLNAPLHSGTPEYWSQHANDSKLHREQRRLAAALLFGAFTKIGFDSEHMRTALPDARWLDECRLTRVVGGGGNWYWFKDGTPYQLELFPERNYDPSWAIYFTLSSKLSAEDPNAVKLGLAFLRGELRDSHATLSELVLVYPMPGCENWSQIGENILYKS
jgi:hypothetical protein